MIVITKASNEFSMQLSELHKRNVDFHTPWVYNSNADAYFQKIAEGKRIGYFLWEKNSDELIGVVNLNEPVMGIFQSAYLGYYIDRRFANQGLMTQGLAKVITNAFTKDSFHRLEANIQPDNLHSIALVKSLGFKKEGFSPRYLRINDSWQDHERWAITLEDWRG